MGDFMVLMPDRIRRFKAEGSPTFYFTNSGTIAASGTYVIDLELQSDAQGRKPAKYLPLDSFVCKNTSAHDIEANIGGHSIIVVANSIGKKTDIGIRQIYIENLGTGNITAGQLRISVWLEPITEDKLLRQKLGGRL